MIASAPSPDRSAAGLQELYGRYKSLVLAAGAALVLDEPCANVTAEAQDLVERSRSAAGEPGPLQPHFAACHTAAQELTTLLDAADGGRGSAADLDGVRASHARLRSAVWDVLPFEYVPCCAAPHGDPDPRRHDG